MSDQKRLTIRLTLSVAFGLCVMMVPLYLVVGSVGYIANGQFWTRKQLEKLDKELQDYRVQHAAYPTNLEALNLAWGLKDRWNRPFIYSLSNGKPLVESLGRDGVRGGIGLDADCSNQNPQPPESMYSK